MIREDTKKRARKQIYLQFLSASALLWDPKGTVVATDAFISRRRYKQDTN